MARAIRIDGKSPRVAALRDSSQLGWAALFALILGLGGCRDDEASTDYRPTFTSASERGKTEYVVGIHPLHNPQQLHRVFGPLVEYLNANLKGVTLRFEASTGYASFDEKLYAGKFHFALPNPYQTVQSFEHGYRAFGKMGDDVNFRGIILVRRDSEIAQVGDLRGQVISYPAPTALAAAMMPQHYLQTQGLDVFRDTTSIYVGSQESSIMSVVMGISAAAATWPAPWKRFARHNPELAAEIEVKWETPPLVNNGLVVRDDVPAEVTRRIGELLFSLHESDEGRTILAGMELSQFEPAENATFQPVQAFVDEFPRTMQQPE